MKDGSVARFVKSSLSLFLCCADGLALPKETPSPTPCNTSFSLLSSPSFPFFPPPEIFAFVFLLLLLRSFVSHRFGHSSFISRNAFACQGVIYVSLKVDFEQPNYKENTEIVYIHIYMQILKITKIIYKQFNKFYNLIT